MVEVTDNLRQEFLIKSGLFALKTEGSELLPLFESISKLNGIIGEGFLSENDKKRLNEFGKYVSKITSYILIMDKKKFINEDISSSTFLAYQKTLSMALYHLFVIDEIYTKLSKELVKRNIFKIEKMSISSSDWTRINAILRKEDIEETQIKMGIYPQSISEIREERESAKFGEEESEEQIEKDIENY